MNGVTPNLDREQLAALVCTALGRHGVDVVLSGGGAAAIYAPNAYESMDLDFIPIHFDFVDPEGNPLFSVERKMSIGDRYRVSVPDQRVDFRVAAAVAVALDALMSR